METDDDVISISVSVSDLIDTIRKKKTFGSNMPYDVPRDLEMGLQVNIFANVIIGRPVIIDSD